MSFSNRIAVFACAFLFIIAATSNFAQAVQIEADEWQFGVNGFIGSEFTHMGKMPILGNDSEAASEGDSVITYMDDMSYLSYHMNLLVSAERDNIKTVVNLALRDAHDITTEGEHEVDTDFGVAEVYGVYLFHDALKLSFGSMLAPFGIYNDVRYITPLFASVVLPQMYEMPPNYVSENNAVSQIIMPPNANMMMSGDFLGDGLDIEYYLYVANGSKRGDIGYGGRLRIILRENLKLGASFYKVDNDESISVGGETLTGLDIVFKIEDILKLEGEYVNNDFEDRKDRLSYYGRLTGYIGSFSPFVSYDYVEDNEISIFKKGQRRYSLGFGYAISNYVTFKSEYHLFQYDDAVLHSESGNKPDSDKISMFKSVVIFVF